MATIPDSFLDTSIEYASENGLNNAADITEQRIMEMTHDQLVAILPYVQHGESLYRDILLLHLRIFLSCFKKPLVCDGRVYILKPPDISEGFNLIQRSH
jgi:hypothetical protein